MATIYDHIEQNKRRTWLLVLLFPLTFVILGYLCLFGFYQLGSSSYWEGAHTGAAYSQAAAGRAYSQAASSGAPAALERANQTALQVLPWLWAGAVLWIVIAYFMGDQLLLHGARAVEIYREDQPEIYNLVENLCISQGMPTPRIYIIDDSSLNAFATGRDPEHASVALTKGIVLKLERAELEGVVAHELAHIQNRDIRLMLITVAGISFFTFLSEICFRIGLHSSRRSSKNSGGAAALMFLLGVFFALYGYLIAPLIRLAISRTREFQADATAALMTRHPAALASALRKISTDPRVEVLDEHASMAAMCIENPLHKQSLFASLSGMFSTHPPIEARIAALREMDGRI